MSPIPIERQSGATDRLPAKTAPIIRAKAKRTFIGIRAMTNKG